jgi:hypothetical protein
LSQNPREWDPTPALSYAISATNYSNLRILYFFLFLFFYAFFSLSFSCYYLFFVFTIILITVRYVCVVHPAELALMGQGLRSGVVVSSGHFTTQVVPVWEGEVLTDKIRFFPVAGMRREGKGREGEGERRREEGSVYYYLFIYLFL